MFALHLCFSFFFLLLFLFFFLVSTGHLKTRLICKIKGARVVVELISQHLRLQLNNLTIKLSSGTNIKLIMKNITQLKWNRYSTLLFLEKFKCKTF